MGNLAKGYRNQCPAHQCPCQVHHEPQGDKRGKEISDSSDLESVPGTGFVDLFRRNVPYERAGPCPTALDLYSLNHVPMSKNSRIRMIREFRETREPKEEAINQEFDKVHLIFLNSILSKLLLFYIRSVFMHWLSFPKGALNPSSRVPTFYQPLIQM